jgi:FtsZ-interacting cell division protein ZipA
MLGIFQSNMQTGILVLIVIMLILLCLSLFFLHRAVRDMQSTIIGNKHDIRALQGFMNDAGMAALNPIMTSHFPSQPFASNNEKKKSNLKKQTSTPSPENTNLIMNYSTQPEETQPEETEPEETEPEETEPEETEPEETEPEETKLENVLTEKNFEKTEKNEKSEEPVESEESSDEESEESSDEESEESENEKNELIV